MTRIGIILTDLYDFSQNVIYNGINFYCKKNNLQNFVFIGSYPEDYANCNTEKDSLFSIICRSDLDVLILYTSSLSTILSKDEVVKFIEKLPPIPKISIGVDIPGINSIVVNNKLGVSEIMDHLIEKHGAKRIAFIKGPESNQEAEDRFETYKEALIRHGIPYNSKLVAPGSFSPGDGRKGISLILDIRKEKFDSVFCCHDLSAFEVIKSLTNRGYSIPHDISVVGFDNLDLSSSYSPGLTTIRQPFYDIGLLVGTYITNIINKKENPLLTVIDTQTIYRDSCGCNRDIKYDLVNKESLEVDIETIIYNAKLKIKKENRFKYDNGDASNILDESIEKIASSILSCIENLSYTELTDTTKIILKNTIEYQYGASFWKHILEDFFIIISNYTHNKERQLHFSVILTKTILMLYETEMKIKEFNQIDNRSLIQYINYIGDKLLTSKENSELKQILRRNLSTLNIQNCFIVLFTGTVGKGELFFSRNTDNFFDEEVYTFDMTTIIPSHLGSVSEQSYVVSSLRIDNRQLGYIVMNSQNAPNIVFNFITEKISYGFKNIEIIQKMNSYTQELKAAVANRTYELEQANIKLQERSIRDQLTGLYNRRFLEDTIIPNIKEALNNKEPYNCGIILVDLDHFKLVNDIYGHSSGDIVIKELGKIFSYLVRPVDHVIRLGGEEFLLVLRDFDEAFLERVVNKVRKTVKKSIFRMDNGEVISKTCSLGAMYFSAVTPELLDFKSAIAIIDKGLYISKNKGRDRGCIIKIDSDQFQGCANCGEYITNNFEKCITTNKIKLIDCYS